MLASKLTGFWLGHSALSRVNILLHGKFRANLLPRKQTLCMCKRWIDSLFFFYSFWNSPIGRVTHLRLVIPRLERGQ